MRQNDFENTPMLKLVMSLAIPSMIAQLVNILYSIEYNGWASPSNTVK